jgi:hypothetical protein
MLTESSYTVRIEYDLPAQGANFYVDRFTLQSVTATERSSWGEIKSLYR